MSNVSFEELQRLTGFETPAEVAANLERNRVKFYRGKYGRPYTTQAALDARLTGRPQKQSDNDADIIEV